MRYVLYGMIDLSLYKYFLIKIHEGKKKKKD